MDSSLVLQDQASGGHSNEAKAPWSQDGDSQLTST
jgi:hypothetical protein